MKRILAVMVLVGLPALIATASDNSPPPFASREPPEKDRRLAILSGAQPQKIGIFTYYANKGGGYTFKRDGIIEFYALPFIPYAYRCSCTALKATFDVNDGFVTSSAVDIKTLSTVGLKPMPADGQTVYRSEMNQLYPGVFVRNDVPVATWASDAPGVPLRLSRWCDDSETRLKLKSIVPVLEHAEHGQ
jgi:hypothetical protein